MTYYKANASVIFNDSEGNQIETFVIFDTDRQTGLTHINHENLRVPPARLQLHTKTVCDFHLPIADAFSYEIIKKLRDKYAALDSQKKVIVKPRPALYVLAKAS